MHISHKNARAQQPKIAIHQRLDAAVRMGEETAETKPKLEKEGGDQINLKVKDQVRGVGARGKPKALRPRARARRTTRRCTSRSAQTLLSRRRVCLRVHACKTRSLSARALTAAACADLRGLLHQEEPLARPRALFVRRTAHQGHRHAQRGACAALALPRSAASTHRPTRAAAAAARPRRHAMPHVQRRPAGCGRCSALRAAGASAGGRAPSDAARRAPAQLELEDGDSIDAMMEQVGGWRA